MQRKRKGSDHQKQITFGIVLVVETRPRPVVLVGWWSAYLWLPFNYITRSAAAVAWRLVRIL